MVTRLPDLSKLISEEPSGSVALMVLFFARLATPACISPNIDCKGGRVLTRLKLLPQDGTFFRKHR